jgi:hypothetical protein
MNLDQTNLSASLSTFHGWYNTVHCLGKKKLPSPQDMQIQYVYSFLLTHLHHQWMNDWNEPIEAVDFVLFVLCIFTDNNKNTKISQILSNKIIESFFPRSFSTISIVEKTNRMMMIVDVFSSLSQEAYLTKMISELFF